MGTTFGLMYNLANEQLDKTYIKPYRLYSRDIKIRFNLSFLQKVFWHGRYQTKKII